MTIAEMSASRSRSLRWFGVAAGLLLLQIVILYAMGRIPICECGYVKLFGAGCEHAGQFPASGRLVYALAYHSRLSVLLVRLAAVPQQTVFHAAFLRGSDRGGVGTSRNSPIIIDRYRTATMALGYTGDSILNSAMDTVFMALGFLFAARVPVWLTVIIAIFFEIFTGWLIRDNLTLNVVMLVWPLDAIKEWQNALPQM